jgi:hypothetical protein
VSAIKTRDIRSALLSKGFRSDNRDHEYLWLYVGERQTRVRTWLSYGIPEYGDDLLGKVKKQLGISKPQLIALVDCPLTYDEYVAHLMRSGIIRE